MESHNTPFLFLLTRVLKIWAHACLPKIDGEINMRQIRKPIEVLRDRLGVPHIFAANIDDLMIDIWGCGSRDQRADDMAGDLLQGDV